MELEGLTVLRSAPSQVRVAHNQVSVESQENISRPQRVLVHLDQLTLRRHTVDVVALEDIRSGSLEQQTLGAFGIGAAATHFLLTVL
jgi:predicted metalloprotease